MAYESTNPFDGKTVKNFDELGDEQIEKKITTAAKTYATRKKTSLTSLPRAAATVRTRNQVRPQRSVR